MKADVVNADEFDVGSRQKLNLGHTIGHGVEVGSHYEISHGNAVSIGIAIVSKAAFSKGICSNKTYAKIINVLEQFSLPVTTNIRSECLFEAALSDKKRSGDSINLIVPRAIGQCDITPVSIDILESFIKAGL